MIEKLVNMIRLVWTDICMRLNEWMAVRSSSFFSDTALALSIFVGGGLIAWLAWRIEERVCRRFGVLSNLKVMMFVAFIHIGWFASLAGLGAAGVVLGFAFQESLGSFAAGTMIGCSGPFRVGDEISVAGYDGFVHGMGYTQTIIRTYDNRLVAIPNKTVWESSIVNYTRMPTRRIDRTTYISYECDFDKAMEEIRKAACSIPGVLQDPEPSVFVSSLDEDSAITVTIWLWVKTKDYWPVWKSSYGVLCKAYGAAGIDAPYPQLDVSLKKEDA